MAVTLGSIAPIGFDDFADPAWIECMQQLGAATCQAYRNPQADLNARDMRTWLDQRPLPCDSLHALFGGDLDPSSPDETLRLHAVDVYRGELQLVRRLGGDLIVVHCSPPIEQRPSAAELELRTDQLSRSMQQLAQAGLDAGVRVAWENLPAQSPAGSDPAQLAGLLRKLDLPATGMCFDTGHAHLIGDVAACFAACSDQVLYIHASDNCGQADEHLMCFSGTIDWQELARAIADSPCRCPFMLETFYPLDKLRQMVASDLPDRLAGLLDSCT
ncbi:MAG: sugar phosphate isomerase/epimerase family protein [Phycisphaerae bacterium]